MHLLHLIERHLRATGVSASTFGRETLNDPRFVHDLRRMGREPRARTAARVVAALTQNQEARP